MTYELFGIAWASPSSLLYAPLFALLIVIVWWRTYKRAAKVKLLVHSKWQTTLMRNFSSRKNIIKSSLLSLGFVFLFLALLRPQWGYKEEVVEQEGRDVCIALDISRSMLAQDVKPNRLECAKKKIKTLLDNLSCERVSLIVFSGSAFVQCPLTKDYMAFYMFLDTLDVETISSGTTALDRAIEMSLRLFSTVPDRKNKILMIFTDGEDFSSNLAGIKKKAVDLGMNIFTIGVGTPEGAPIPVVDERGRQVGVQKDAKGTIVISPLNEGILQTLASDTSGSYLRLTKNNDDMKQLVTFIERYEKEKFEDRKINQKEEQYMHCAAVSFVCFLFEWML